MKQLLPFLLISLAGCANTATPEQNARTAAIERHNAAYFAKHPQEQPSRPKAESLEQRLDKLKIGMHEGMAISVMGVKPARMEQLRTAGGEQHILVYTESQFWTLGQAFVQGMARKTSSPNAKDGVVRLQFQNQALSAIHRSLF